jgi:hypothetical protein
MRTTTKDARGRTSKDKMKLTLSPPQSSLSASGSSKRRNRRLS